MRSALTYVHAMDTVSARIVHFVTYQGYKTESRIKKKKFKAWN